MRKIFVHEIWSHKYMIQAWRGHAHPQNLVIYETVYRDIGERTGIWMSLKWCAGICVLPVEFRE